VARPTALFDLDLVAIEVDGGRVRPASAGPGPALGSRAGDAAHRPRPRRSSLLKLDRLTRSVGATCADLVDDYFRDGKKRRRLLSVGEQVDTPAARAARMVLKHAHRDRPVGARGDSASGPRRRCSTRHRKGEYTGGGGTPTATLPRDRRRGAHREGPRPRQAVIAAARAACTPTWLSLRKILRGRLERQGLSDAQRRPSSHPVQVAPLWFAGMTRGR